MLPAREQERVERAIRFFLRCLTEEVITIPQLAPIYQVQFQLASLEQSYELVGLQRDHNQLTMTLIDTVAQNQQLLAAPAASNLPKTHDNLPPQYGEFLGREKDIARVLEGLQLRWPLISIEGLAGMGKTTLAIQIARCCLPGLEAILDPPFEYVVWISARDRPEQTLWLNELLDTIARLLGDPSIVKLSLEQMAQKQMEVDQLLRNYRTLVIVDNFETIKDPTLELWIQRVPEPSKVLITSRYNQLRRAWNINLKGLEEPIGLEFMRKHARRWGLRSIELASDDALLPLIQVTGGNPRAIELALGHVKRGTSLNVVIEHLHTAGKAANDVFDDLFMRAWEIMTKDAQDVLLASIFFINSSSREALGAASGLTEYHLDTAMEELVDLMLLDSNEEPSTLSLRYSIHPLTRAFAHAQLRNAQDFEKQARIRWSTYYLDFVSRHLVREQPAERYWNTLVISSFTPIDPEWSNLRRVLEWADQEGQDQILVELMLLLAHYMGWHFLIPERLYYARKAAEAADRLNRKEDAVLFRVDSLGWILLETGQLADAKQEITIGLNIAQNLAASSPAAADLIALATTFLARALLEEGNLAEATALIDKVVALECRPVIQCRVDVVAGDIAYKRNNNAEAMMLYENAYRIGQQYGSEGEDIDLHYRLGNANLAIEDLVAAETHFNKALEVEHRYITHETIYAKYGLARIAMSKNEKDQARRLAQEVLRDLSPIFSSHQLVNQVQDFLRSLEEE